MIAVFKGCPKFCWSDGCLARLSSKTAQSSAEVMAVFKDCHLRLPKVQLKLCMCLCVCVCVCLCVCVSVSVRVCECVSTRV